MLLSVGEVCSIVEELKDGHFIESNLRCIETFEVSCEVITASGINNILFQLSKDWRWGSVAGRILKKFRHKMVTYFLKKDEDTVQKRNLKRKSDGEFYIETVMKKIKSDTEEFHQKMTEKRRISHNTVEVSKTPPQGLSRKLLTPPLIETPESVAQKLMIMSKMKKLEAEKRSPKIVELTRAPAQHLSERLKTLPLAPSSEEIQKLLKSGLTAELLREAEVIVGRQMARVDSIWWALINRDFGGFTGSYACNVRELYDCKRIMTEKRQKRRSEEEQKELSRVVAWDDLF